MLDNLGCFVLILNCCLQFLETPLHLAVSRGHWATAALLLRYGADPDAKNKVRWAHWPCESGVLFAAFIH